VQVVQTRSDHTGALARIGPAERLAALALVQTGHVYDLGMDIDERMPGGPPEAFPRFARSFCATPGRQNGAFDYAAEAIFATLHTSSHIDAFVHVQRDGRIFGGALDTEVRGDRGFSQHGVETIPPILGRGVVLDVAGERGALADGYEITVADVEATLARSAVTLLDGDIVLVRTGKIRDFHRDPDRFHEHAPGVGRDAAIWLHERGMAVLGVDTSGTEPAPIADPERTTHVAMLVERGVHLIENVNLDEVCAAGVTEGLFVCLPLRITGATGSWVRPVLVV
jgi:kynurenine formamidase